MAVGCPDRGVPGGTSLCSRTELCKLGARTCRGGLAVVRVLPKWGAEVLIAGYCSQ